MDDNIPFVKLYWNGEDAIPYARVDGYPDPLKRYTTLAWRTANFAGTISIYGSIKSQPQDGDWFLCDVITAVAPGMFEEKSKNGIVNYRGRIVTMKVVTQTNSGLIDYVVAK